MFYLYTRFLENLLWLRLSLGWCLRMREIKMEECSHVSYNTVEKMNKNKSTIQFQIVLRVIQSRVVWKSFIGLSMLMHMEAIRSLSKRRVDVWVMEEEGHSTLHMQRAWGRKKTFLIFLDISRTCPADIYKSIFYENSIVLGSMRNINLSNMWFSAPFPVSAWQNARSSTPVVCGV